MLGGRWQCLEVDISTVPLWSLFRSLFKAGTLQFNVSALGPGGEKSARTFWERALEQEWGAKHPVLEGRRGDALGKIIPLQIHVDGAEVYNNKEYLVFSISSVLAQGSCIWDNKFVVLKLPVMWIKTKSMMQLVMRRVAAFFAWNFAVIASGRLPNTGFYGESLKFEAADDDKIMGEFIGAFAFFKADGKARVQAHNFTAHNYGSIFCCDGCLATNPFASVLANPVLCALLFTHGSPSAPWR